MWSEVKLKDILSVHGGKRLPAKHDYVDDNTGYKYLRVVDFFCRKPRIAELKNINKNTYEILKRYEIHSGDLYISIAGSIGYAGVLKNSSYSIILTENAAKLSPKTRINTKYAAYLINSETVQKQIDLEMGVGGGVPKLALFRIANLDLLIPLYTQQNKIVDILGTVDTAIKKTELLIAKYEQIKQGMMQDLFTRGVDENGKLRLPYADAPHLYKYSPLGMIPNEWKFDKFFEKIRLNYGKSQKLVSSTYGNIPVYGTGGLLAFSTIALFEQDSVLIGRKGSINSPYFIEGPFWVVDTAYYVSDFITGSMKWLSYKLGTLNFSLLNEATGVPSLNRETIYKQWLSFPSANEQNLMVSNLEAIDNLLNSEQLHLSKLLKQKKGLMQDLLTGKIIVKSHKDKCDDYDIFSMQGTDEIYEIIRKRDTKNDKTARDNICKKYKDNKNYLDSDFSKKLREDFYGRLWELTLSEYLRTCSKVSLQPCSTYGKKNQSKPDFCFLTQNKKYYLEATTASPGNVQSLSKAFTDADCEVPRIEYKERLCEAINTKIERYKYYKKIMSESDGFILAISVSKIPSYNQPLDYTLDLSCLFGMSEREINIKSGKMSHLYQPQFQKKSKVIKETEDPSYILSNYFSTDEYSYISAAFISYSELVFFPDYFEGFNWGESKNDFILIHNPYAKNPLPQGIFPVCGEFIYDKHRSVIIDLMEKTT